MRYSLWYVLLVKDFLSQMTARNGKNARMAVYIHRFQKNKEINPNIEKRI